MTKHDNSRHNSMETSHRSLRSPELGQKGTPPRRNPSVAPSTPGPGGKGHSNRNKKKEVPSFKKLETKVIDSTIALFKSKGYKVTTDLATGVDMIASKPVEVGDDRCTVVVLLLKLHFGDGPIKVCGNSDGGLQLSQPEGDNINTLCDKFLDKTRSLASSIYGSERTGAKAEEDYDAEHLVEGLQVHSLKLLFGRMDYKRLDGRNVDFWITPVLLTTSKLQDEANESKPYIPIPARVKGHDMDIVQVTHLASFLDFRDKEVSILGRELSDGAQALSNYGRQLRRFKLLTLVASLILFGSFLIFAFGVGLCVLVALIGAGLALLVELLGGVRLFMTYRCLRKDMILTPAPGSQRITPELVVANEGEFSPEELEYLFAKYGGAELFRLKKELRHQRVEELANKVKDLLTTARELESEELYSEVILTLDRAVSCAISGALLTIGAETRGRKTEEWIPTLRKIFPSMNLEDTKYLRELRERVNKGHDASKEEAKIASDRVSPLLHDSFSYLKSFLKKNDSQLNPTSSAFVSQGMRTSTEVNRLLKKTNEPELGKSNGALNPSQSIKFLLNVTADEELRDLGLVGTHLIEAKKALGIASQTGETVKTNHDNLPKVGEELDNLARELNFPSRGSEVTYSIEKDPPRLISDENDPPSRVLSFEDVNDFRRVISHGQRPLVASFVDNDEPSREVENLMRKLVMKYHSRAAFISVSSSSEDIARECKIKSYPSIIVFSEGRMVNELRSTNAHQLEQELLKVIDSAAPPVGEESFGAKIRSPVPNRDDSFETNQTDDAGDTPRGYGVTDST